MSDDILGTDLFGDPVQSRREGRGRPEHVWTLSNSNKVLLAFWRGLSVKDAAMLIGVSAPTLRKVYFSEVAKRREARLKGETKLLELLSEQAGAGNVAAVKELFKQMDRLRQRDQVQVMAPAPTARAPKLGKKEAAKQAAASVTGLYEPRPAPQALN